MLTYDVDLSFEGLGANPWLARPLLAEFYGSVRKCEYVAVVRTSLLQGMVRVRLPPGVLGLCNYVTTLALP